METAWLIFFSILMLLGIPIHYSTLNNWPPKRRIFLSEVILCVSSVLLVLSICNHENLLFIVMCALIVFICFKNTKKYLRWLEEDAVKKALEAEKKRTSEPVIIDADSFTVCD